MAVRRNLWDPSSIDGHSTDSATAPDDGILLPDHAFQFDAAAPDDAAGSDDWSGVAIEVDFVDGALMFADTTSDLPASLDDAGVATVQNLGPAGLDWRITPDFDDDPGWVPGVVTQPSSSQASLATDDGVAPTETSLQSDTAIETPQAPSPAGLDRWVTPDFDDDPGWYPGWIPTPATAPRTDDGAAPTSSAVTSNADEPPRDETVTSSLTLAELNEQYPGIVWPANWWLL